MRAKKKKKKLLLWGEGEKTLLGFIVSLKIYEKGLKSLKNLT